MNRDCSFGRWLGAALLSGSIAIPAAAHQPPGKAGVIGLDAWAAAGSSRVDAVLTVRVGERIELQHLVSRDRGATWSTPTAIPTAVAPVAASRGNEPQIAAHGELVVVVWTIPGSSRFGSGPLASARSLDGGRSWQPANNPADDGSTDGHGFADLAVDAAGNFHLVWLDNRDGGQGLRAARSSDGSRWDANLTIDRRTCECCWNRLAVAADSTIHVLYRDRDPRDMAVASREVNGATASWNRLGSAGTFNWQIDSCPHVGGGLVAIPPVSSGSGRRLLASVWTGDEKHSGAYLVDVTAPPQAASTSPSATSQSLRLLPDSTARRSDLAAHGASILVAWEGREPSGGSQIRAAYTTDQGATWSRLVELSVPGAEAALPIVLAVEQGFLVMWSERQPAGQGTTWASRLLPLSPALSP